MLTLFILPSEEGRNIKALVDSFTFEGLEVIYVPVDSIAYINGYDKKTPWYGVFYENEFIDERLAAALPVFFGCSKYDVLIVFKHLSDRVVFFPRFFRNKVYLGNDLLPTFKLWSYEKILNGWVFENARNTTDDKRSIRTNTDLS